MKTYDNSHDDKSGKIKRKGKNSNLKKIQRYIASLNPEQISRMMEDSGKPYVPPGQTDVTGQAIFLNALQQRPLSIQAKLEISQPGDTSELQADKVADAVSRGDVNMSRMTMEQTGSEINMKGEGGTLTTTPEFIQQLEGTKGSGSQMEPGVQREMETHMGADLSGVNIHTGTTAAGMNENLNAKAFTHGQDIYFNEGKYNPGTPEGKNLLAHELTHTQQSRVLGSGVERKIRRQAKKGYQKPQLTEEQKKFLTDYGYDAENETDHFKQSFQSWWKEQHELPTAEQMEGLRMYNGLNIRNAPKAILKRLAKLLNKLNAVTWVLEYPQYGLYQRSTWEADTGRAFVLIDEYGSYSSIAFMIKGDSGTTMYYSGEYGFPPPGLKIGKPNFDESPGTDYGKSAISVSVQPTGAGPVKNPHSRLKPGESYKQFYSGLFKTSRNRQLWYTLNNDPVNGHAIGNNVLGEVVHLIQEALKVLLPDFKFDPKELERWKYGSTTTAAVKKFQYAYDVDFGVEKDGRAGRVENFERLNNANAWTGSMAQAIAAANLGTQILEDDGIVGPATVEALDKALTLREDRKTEEELLAPDKAWKDKRMEEFKTVVPVSYGKGPEIPVIPMPPMDFDNLRAHFIEPLHLTWQISRKSLFGIPTEPMLGTTYEVFYQGVQIGFFTIRFISGNSDKFAALRHVIEHPAKWKKFFTIGTTGANAANSVPPSPDPDDLALIHLVRMYAFSGYEVGPTPEDIAVGMLMEAAATPVMFGAMRGANMRMAGGATRAPGRITAGSGILRPPGYQQENKVGFTPFTPPKITTDKQGFLSNGTYRLDQAGMEPHTNGSTGKSQFKYGVNAGKAVLDGAAYADRFGLWQGTKAKVFVSDGIIGYSNGQPTQWMNIYRTSNGMIHGTPTNTPGSIK